MVYCLGLRQVLFPSGSRGRWITGFLFFLIALCLLWALFGWKPWDEKVIEHFAKGKAKAYDYAAVALWWTAVVNVFLLLGLVFTQKWWGKSRAGKKVHFFSRKGQVPTRQIFFWFILIALVLLGAGVRAPRLSHSFWNDEEYAFRRFVHGWWEVKKEKGEEKLEFRKAKWVETFFRTNGGNNHVLQSVTSRVCDEVGMLLGGEKFFRESVVRLPAFFAGLGSLVWIGLLSRRVFCNQKNALFAILILVLSPWHIRYSVEARGYAFLYFFLLLSLWFALRAREGGRLRDWLGLSLAQAFCVFSFAGSLYTLAALQVTLGFLVLKEASLHLEKKKPLSSLFKYISPYLAANIFFCILVLPFIFGHYPQIVSKLSSGPTQFTGEMKSIWFIDLWTHLICGLPWQTAETSLHLGSSVAQEKSTQPLFSLLVYVVMPLLCFMGMIFFLLKTKTQGILILCTLLGGALFAYAHNAFRGIRLHPWYLSFLVLVIPFCIAALFPSFRRKGEGRAYFFALLPLLLSIGILLFFYKTAGLPLAKINRQPMRQVVRELRGTTPYWEEKINTNAIVGVVGVSRRQLATYDPHAIIINDVVDLEKLVQRAHQEKNELFLYLCGALRLEKEKPALYKKIAHAGQFKKTGQVLGLEELFSYHIFSLQIK